MAPRSWANGATSSACSATPSTTEPWGWQLFGHHLVLNCFVLGEQMVLTPAFWGAEPNYADHGPFKGIRLFQDEERAGLKLMRAFSPDSRSAPSSRIR